MRWDATGYGAHTEKATAGAGADVVFRGRRAGLLLDLLPARESSAGGEHRARDVLPRERAGDRARLSAGAGLAHDDRRRRRRRAARSGVRRAHHVRSAGRGGARDVLRPPIRSGCGGHASAGATAPSTSWFLAEGATGAYFTTFVLLANPNDEPADVTLTFLPDTGVPVTKSYTIPGRQRLTRNIALEDAALANAAVATRVESTRPIVVERAQYWRPRRMDRSAQQLRRHRRGHALGPRRRPRRRRGRGADLHPARQSRRGDAARRPSRSCATTARPS